MHFFFFFFFLEDDPLLLVAVLVVSLSKKSSCWPESTRFLNMAVFGSIRATWNSVNTTSMCAHMRVYKRQGVSVSSGWFFRVIGAEFFLNPESHSGYFLSQFLTNFISNKCNSTFFMSLLNNRGSTLYFYTIQNTVLTPCSQRKGTFFSTLHIGSVWEQGNISTVVFFRWQWDNMFPASFSSLSLLKSWCHVFMDERCEVFFCWKNNKRETGRVRNRGV